MKRILILNGPNLNMLGKREPEHYGTTTLDDIEKMLRKQAKDLNCNLDFFQSNAEGALINAIHEAMGKHDAIVFNPGAYTHTSVALRDAVASVAPLPVIEVHLSNVYARAEEFRHKSFIAPVAKGQISGFGAYAYTLGLDAAMHILK